MRYDINIAIVKTEMILARRDGFAPTLIEFSVKLSNPHMSAETPSERFPAKDYFLHHFGFVESVDAVRERISVVESSDHLEIVSSANGRRFNIGQFHIRTPSSYEGKLG